MSAAKPLVSEIPAAVPANETSALKLKPKIVAPLEKAAGGVNLASLPTPPAVPTASPANSLPPLPVTLAPDATLTPFAKPIHIPVASDLKADDAATEKKRQRRVLKVGAITLVAVALVVCAGGFFAWKQFTKSPASASQTPAVTTTQTTVAVPAGGDGDTQAAPAPSSEGVKIDAGSAEVNPPTAAETVVHLSPPADIPVPPVSASPEFRAFVATVKISGVFQGTNGRAFINGRLTRLGDLVDSQLGIRFEGIDAEKKLLIFKDASVATTARKY